MTSLMEQFPRRPHRQTTSPTSEKKAPTAEATVTSPQDFYRDMSKREDIRRILTRLAQVEHGPQ